VRRHHVPLVTAIVAAASLLTACGAEEVDRPAAQPTDSIAPSAPSTNEVPVTEVPVTEVPVTDVPVTEPGPAFIEIVAVHPDVEYYGACGNETVDVDGTTYYPLLDDELDALDESLYPLEQVDPGQSGLTRVVAPGPGDDVGTMIVYRDGIARFESQSGRVLWLTDQERTYNWVC
jgi:hypothetical protein